MYRTYKAHPDYGTIGHDWNRSGPIRSYSGNVTRRPSRELIATASVNSM